jgi:hypothetical protein
MMSNHYINKSFDYKHKIFLIPTDLHVCARGSHLHNYYVFSPGEDYVGSLRLLLDCIKFD